MPTLFLSAPNEKTQAGTHRKDFYVILASSVGPDYAIYANLIVRACSGMKVVVFDRNRQLQADGILSNYTPTSRTGNNVQRYDLKLLNLTQVTYTNPPRVNRCGVAIA